MQPAKHNFPEGSDTLLKLTLNSLSVNYRLQVFHYAVYSPSAASASFIGIPRASSLWELTLHLPWCSCSRLGSGRSRTSLQDTLVQRGCNSSARFAVWGCCRKHRSSSSHPHHHHHHHHTHLPAHAHIWNCPFRSWSDCSPSGTITHPEPFPHEGATWQI